MLIFAIDDEPRMLKLLYKAIKEAVPDAEIMDFEYHDELLGALKAGKRPDVVFSDIELEEINGIGLAVMIKDISPDTNIIFVTGYSQYAADAYRIHANGYILKPVTSGRVTEELEQLNLTANKEEQTEKLHVRCFGFFEVYWQGELVNFKRSQAKELLAFLIDNEGTFCTGEEIISALWEDVESIRDARHYLRVLTQELRETLENIGMKELLVRERNRWAVRKELLDCDYYRMLEGDVSAVNAYHGEYMKQYSWAELTVAKLSFM